MCRINLNKYSDCEKLIEPTSLKFRKKDKEKRIEGDQEDNVLPSKNRVFCPIIGRQKQLFETKEKALRFLKFNQEYYPNGGKGLRPYYCEVCGGWHLTHAEKKNQDYFAHELVKSVKCFAMGKKYVCEERENEIINFISRIPESVIYASKILRWCYVHDNLLNVEDKVCQKVQGVISKISSSGYELSSLNLTDRKKLARLYWEQV